MNKSILSLFATIGMISSAVATDLPSRKIPLPPTRPVASPVEALTPISSNWYAGVNAGSTLGSGDINTKESRGLAGAVVGYQFSPYFRMEGDFTNRFSGKNTRDGQAVIANGIVQLPLQSAVTPYVLGGIGYGFNYYGDKHNNAAALFNVGGGARYALSNTLELDGRYKYVQKFHDHSSNANKLDENQVTLGVNYKF